MIDLSKKLEEPFRIKGKISGLDFNKYANTTQPVDFRADEQPLLTATMLQLSLFLFRLVRDDISSTN